MRISIAMATYNGAKYIQEQLNSLSSQTVLPFELVVCDDCSTDDTLSIVCEYAKSAPFPVRVYRNEANLGYPDNFLHAASLCEGEWIGFCDQDDVWLPHKLATVATAIEANESDQLMLVAHSAYLVGHDLKLTGRRDPDFRKTRIVGRNKRHGFGVIGGFACVFRCEFVKGFDWTNRPRDSVPVCKRQAHDKWICMLANALGDTLYLSEPLVYFRRHEKSVTVAYDKKTSIKQRIEESQFVGADLYQFLSNVAMQSAEILDKQSTVTEKRIWQSYLKEHADKFRSLAHVCALRADIYRSKNTMQRLSRIGYLFVKGGYIGNKFCAFGVRSFLKDFHYCLLKKGD